MCDKAGAENKDLGPGGDWNCLMSWTDPEVPMPPEGYVVRNRMPWCSTRLATYCSVGPSWIQSSLPVSAS